MKRIIFTLAKIRIRMQMRNAASVYLKQQSAALLTSNATWSA